jgi:hypothetical protein
MTEPSGRDVAVSQVGGNGKGGKGPGRVGRLFFVSSLS